MTASELNFVGDEAMAVRPGEIAAVLEQLWRDADDGNSESLLVQVRTLNLLVLVPADLFSPAVRRAIDNASTRHPGRTIAMIVADEPRPPRAHVAIACRLGSGGKQICGEQITISSGDGGAPLPSLTAALLAPGVPTFLWWHGDPPFGSALWESSAENVDRLVVDSRSWIEPLALLPRFHDALRTQRRRVACADLLWTELTPWRRFVAQSFDLPDTLPQLSKLRRVEIDHADSELGEVAALLMAGWLAGRLGWTLGASRARALGFDTPGGPVAVTLASGESSRQLRRIEFTGEDARIRLLFDPASDCVVHEIDLGGAVPLRRVTRLPQRSLDQLVDEELDMLDADHTFEAALEIAAAVVQAR